MRTAFLALVLFTIVITGTQCEDSRAQMIQEQPKDPAAERLAKAIVDAISTDNYSAFTDLYVTQRELVTVLRSSTDPKDHSKANDSIVMMQKVNKSAKNSFDEVRKEGIRDGIAWDKAEYKSTSFKLDTVTGVEVMQMTIVIGFRGAEYPVTATEVVRTKNGWKLIGRLEYGYYETPYEVALRMQDSIRVADSIVAAELLHIYDSIVAADSSAGDELKKKGKKKK